MVGPTMGGGNHGVSTLGGKNLNSYNPCEKKTKQINRKK